MNLIEIFKLASKASKPFVENQFAEPLLSVGQVIASVAADAAINNTREKLNQMQKPQEITIPHKELIGYKRQVNVIPPKIDIDPNIVDFAWNHPSMWKYDVKQVPVYETRYEKKVVTKPEAVVGAIGNGLMDYAGAMTGIDTKYKDNPVERLHRIASLIRLQS